jgi:hypothetical protein
LIGNHRNGVGDRHCQFCDRDAAGSYGFYSERRIFGGRCANYGDNARLKNPLSNL